MALDDFTLRARLGPQDDGLTKQGPYITRAATSPAPSSPTPGPLPPSSASPTDVSPIKSPRASPSQANGGSVSPSVRHPLERALSPDLPTKDALYLFVNFASYMQSPCQGGEGIESNEDFKDTIRLLDYARSLRTMPYSNVHLLHLKYRFQGEQRDFRSPYATGDYVLPLNYRDSNGRLRNPVPQPFSTLHDPVIKVDYRSDGVFSPLPAQAVFSHIATYCQPPPRIIVISYVSSRVTENHIAAISQWALTSSPPCYVFSPLETRLRERQPLHRALHHAIPMSMYAWPTDDVSSACLPLSFSTSLASLPSPYSGVQSVGTQREKSTSPLTSPQQTSFSGFGLSFNDGAASGRRESFFDNQEELSPEPSRRASSELTRAPTSPLLGRTSSGSSITQKNRHDPVATLTVISGQDDDQPTVSMSGSPSNVLSNIASVPAPVDRIPLWTLAPGVGVLRGSTSASIGVKLGDFSAINLVETADETSRVTPSSLPTRFQCPEMPILPSAKPSASGASVIAASAAGIKMASMDMPQLPRQLAPPVEAPDRPHTPSKVLQPAKPTQRPITNIIAAEGNELDKINASPAMPRFIQPSPSLRQPNMPVSVIHLTPPDRPPMLNHLSPPDLQPGHLTPPERPAPKIITSALTTSALMSEKRDKDTTQVKAAVAGGQSSPEDTVDTSPRGASASFQSWPTPVNKISGWRKGRKEQMEDTLEALHLVPDLSSEGQQVDSMMAGVQNLDLVSESTTTLTSAILNGVIPSESSMAPFADSDDPSDQWIMGLMAML
ncbi:hypothetical protein BD324DRAFT_655746 [Kockovaella imperatae]|uniref:Uncharacterized protein n=1 Tax=Kockovaella imperatae TaxID=4999 RepID=A0A1Y1UK32_9TREE|nr:hypothetical protein BD324DRAFT_655746 [Kockovaella imperatae]ORX38420.1 hypothetical protein BD324DRAFT_655746 [Kockovaella imperatae]